MNIQTFDFSVNLLKALLWQYNDAKNLQSLLEQKQDWYSSEFTEFWDEWYRDVFDLNTCNDFGASVWAIILGVQFTVQVVPDKTRLSFGYGVYHTNYFNGNYANSDNTSIPLNITQKRLVLKLRYYQLIARGTVPETNRFLKYIFGDQGLVYVLDQYDMSYVVYVFLYQPDSQTAFVLDNYDLLPRPAGVGVQYVVISRQVFGYGPYNTNYFDGNYGE